MQIIKNDLDTTLETLRDTGEVLVPYNAIPKLEENIKMLKTLAATVDGYSVLLYFHKVAYEGGFIEVLQVTPTKSIYLPFNVVIKIACRALGGHNLSFFHFYQDNAKIYCWTVLVDEKGRPLPNPFEKQKQEHCVYNGIEYDKLDPKQLDIY